MDEILQALKAFSTEKMTEISNQLKSSPSFVMDKFYTKKTAVLGDSVEVIIKRGAGVVLESVSPNAAHLVEKTDDAYILNIALPRFPLISTITAADIMQFRSLNNQKAVNEALSIKIGEKLAEHKASIDTTLEFMAVGSLFGKILDGKGNVLFDFTSKSSEIAFKSAETIISTLNQIDKAFINEFGKNTPYEVLCGYEFLGKLSQKCLDEKLFESKNASWIGDGGVRVLELFGVKFRPYAAKYKKIDGKEADFLDPKKAVAVPNDKNSFNLYYGRAIHTEALNQAPKLYFSARPEELKNGAGYSIITESRAIPICNRPDGIIKLSFA